MTASIKILTTSTTDSSPSILLISPNGKRILINCGEGCQRSFLESPCDKVRSVNQICLMGIGCTMTGGLPGFILTSADAAESSSLGKKSNENGDNGDTIQQPKLKKSRYSNNKSSSSFSPPSGKLQIIGPKGLKQFITSTRHFMKRDNFHLDIYEDQYHSIAKLGDGVSSNSTTTTISKKKKKMKRKDEGICDCNEKGIFGIQSIPMIQKIHVLKQSHPQRLDHDVSTSSTNHHHTQSIKKDDIDNNNNNNSNDNEDTSSSTPTTTTTTKLINVSSYLFTTSPIPGKFQIDKAKELGIPPGKLYAKLKSGESISFLRQSNMKNEKKKKKKKKKSNTTTNNNIQNGHDDDHNSNDDHDDEKQPEEGVMTTVHPHQVLEGGSDGIAIAVLYCPDEYVMDQLLGSTKYISSATTTNTSTTNDTTTPSESNDRNDVRSSSGNDPIHSLHKFKTKSQAQSSLSSSSTTNKEKTSKKSTNIKLEVMIHIIPKSLFESNKYQSFLHEFDQSIQHITIYHYNHHSHHHRFVIMDKENDDDIDNFYGYDDDNNNDDSSPFHSAMLGAMTRSLLCNDIYMNPFHINHKKNINRHDLAVVGVDDCRNSNNSTDEKSNHSQDKKDKDVVEMIDDGNDNDNDDAINDKEKSTKLETKLNIVNARAQTEYTLIPLAKRGLNNDFVKSSSKCNNGKNDCNSVTMYGISQEEYQEIQTVVKQSGALAKAKMELDVFRKDNMMVQYHSENDHHQNHQGEGRIIFTGTGSAIPCKHRNVTGMYVEMNNGNGMLLDVGEGTIGQLIRCWKSQIPIGINHMDYIRKKLMNIKAVWISHPHADHHLGIIRFLSERNAILRKICVQSSNVNDNDERVVVIASTSLLRFLNEYSIVDPSIGNGYIAVDCQDTLLNKRNPVADRLNKHLGITQCLSVPVSHCWHSYGVVIDCTSFGRLVYSGDCRPSDRLVDVGSNADILIHEATFEDGMEEEAVLKRHSTVGEAISVGKRMKTKNLILTHFSQRYPRIPPLQKEGDTANFPIAVAFDYMRVNPKNIYVASKLTNPLRLLYPESDEVFSLEIDPTKPSAGDILSVPGAFTMMKSCIHDATQVQA